MSEGWLIEKTKLEGEIALLEQKLAGIDKRLEKIESTLSKLVWLVLGSIVTGAMAFILNGGLTIG